MMRRLVMAIAAALALGACTGGPTNAPAQPVTYTAAQVAQCQVAEDSFSVGAWTGQDMADAIGVEPGDRQTVLGLITDSLASTKDVTAPSVASAQWSAMLAAMRSAEPVFRTPLTNAQYTTDLDNLYATIASFDTPCEAAISWGQDNLPH